MVRIGRKDISEVNYSPADQNTPGVEVISLAELRRRMIGREDSLRTERADFHVLLMVDQGVLWHMVDFRDYALDEGSWLWVRPGQVQRFGDISQASGSVVFFPSDTLAPGSASEAALDDPFAGTLWIPSDSGASATRQALGHLAAEFESTDAPLAVRSAVLRHLLAVLLLRLTNQATPAGSMREALGDTFVHFRAAVEKNFARHRDVAFYAQKLGFAPRTLTRSSITAAGVGAKEYIDRRVVLEAKRLLAHTDEPAAGIADRLGFDDASNFVKYFALRAGVTPAAFRQKYRAQSSTSNN